MRPSRGRIIAGVCAAIARRFGWSPTVVRIIYILLSLIPGPLWVLYVVLWITIPSENKPPRAK
ncbi:PspC domain-containing protein [Marisediminicola senii]|uniref:PspC domain-containing protein n=1 Tax=Marisediminicola senii TaxID=2711233 RepID=UPI002E29191E|nr:PspC domain-containing protein [Marisediminicola senii]